MALMKNTTLSTPTNNEFKEMSANLDAFFLVILGMCVICRYPHIILRNLFVDAYKSFRLHDYHGLLTLEEQKLNLSW